MKTLFDSGGHRNIMFNDLSSGAMVQSNQHVIIDGDEGMLLDPGGHKVYSLLLPKIFAMLPTDGLKVIFFSHQDPDIIAAANGWLMVTDAEAYLSNLWMRFIPHFGVDKLVMERIRPIPDEGMVIQMNQKPIYLVPAHFLHSAGNFQVYDPVSKILYTGDLGASFGATYYEVDEFESHIPYIEGFHQRYLPCKQALKMWVNLVRTMDIEMMVPQHGAVFIGKERVNRFIDWLDGLACGLDLMGDAFCLPQV